MDERTLLRALPTYLVDERNACQLAHWRLVSTKGVPRAIKWTLGCALMKIQSLQYSCWCAITCGSNTELYHVGEYTNTPCSLFHSCSMSLFFLVHIKGPSLIGSTNT